MTGTVAEVDARLEWCADLVAYACKDRYVRAATEYVWPDMGALRVAARNRIYEQGGVPVDIDWPRGFGAALMQRAGRAGLIAARNFARPYSGGRTEWRYTTLDLAAAWDAERGLTDGERAERTAAAVRKRYAENQRQYGDEVWRWPMSRSLAAVPQDGIQPALDAGILYEHKDGAIGNGLVPAEEWDSFADAITAHRTRQAQSKAIHSDLVDRVHARIGGSQHNVRYLSTEQLRAILDLIGSEP